MSTRRRRDKIGAPEKTLTAFPIPPHLQSAMSSGSEDSSFWDEPADAESKAPPAAVEQRAEEEDPDDDLAYRVAVLRSLEEKGPARGSGAGAASGQCSR